MKASEESFSKRVGWRSSKVIENGAKVFIDDRLAPSTFLYHMLPWKFAKMILEGRQLRLSPVKTWDDPYEQWWCDLLFGVDGPLRGIEAYGACFTTGAHDEPRWRMAAYRRGSQPIVRLRTSVERLSHIAQSIAQTRRGATFLASVRYEPQDWIIRYGRTVRTRQAKPVTRSAGEMLLHKRLAFNFENEVRLLWLDRAEPLLGLFLGIEPPVVFDQLMVSPYAGSQQRKRIESFCASIGLRTQPSSIGIVPDL